MTPQQAAALADAEPTEDCAEEMPADFDAARFLADFRRPYSVEQADAREAAAMARMAARFAEDAPTAEEDAVQDDEPQTFDWSVYDDPSEVPASLIEERAS